ncbi:disease resistance protein RPP13-like [Tasmannia lanceolata]|uniref:disease resistance protein RPP13-like n=1 Tax=Tasmannia lanceolata TaxID=3420 RepID=UPI004064603F
MAIVILSVFLRVLFEKLASVGVKEFGFLWGIKDNLDKLKSTFTTNQGVLADAEGRQLKEKALLDWLGKLKEVAYDADDILDEFATKALRQQVEIQDHVGFQDRLTNKVFMTTNLQLVGSNELRLRSISDFSSLQSLTIGGISDIESLQEVLLRNQTSLKSLRISRFPKLKSLPKEIEILNALEKLIITDCDEVGALLVGLQNVPSKTFNITHCNKLISLQKDDVCCLASITTLNIRCCENLMSLGEGWENHSALQNLYILECPKLESLPEFLGNICCLYIEDCPSLTCLPSSIKDLTSLRSLHISGCPQLEKQCQKGRGEDWDKIAHIQHIWIASLRV